MHLKCYSIEIITSRNFLHKSSKIQYRATKRKI